ncbi:lasso RiPP family leader peptide-containing protein [Streptomyces sp. 4N509B]
MFGYETPLLVEVGSFAELTLGNTVGLTTDWTGWGTVYVP